MVTRLFGFGAEAPIKIAQLLNEVYSKYIKSF